MAEKTITWATVKFPCREPREYNGRERVNLVVTLESGVETKVWGNPGDKITTLRKSQRIALVDNKGSWDYVETADTTTPPGGGTTGPGYAANGQYNPNVPVGWVKPNADERKAMMEYMDWFCAMEKYAFDRVCEQFADTSLEAGSKKDIATTMVLSVIRRWHLQ